MSYTKFAEFLSISPGTLTFILVITVLYFGVVLLTLRFYKAPFETRFHILAASAAVYVTLFVAWRFLDQRQREEQAEFNSKQTALCFDAAESAAVLAAAYDPLVQISDAEVDKAKLRFQQLYYGSLAIVENDDVATKMIAFHDDIQSKGWGRTGGAETTDVLNRKMNEFFSLKDEALFLADSCRQMLQKHWEIELIDSRTKGKLHISGNKTDGAGR